MESNSFNLKKDETYKLKFNPKKKCARCTQLNAFSCEHNVVVRDTMRMSFDERGKFYTSPKVEDAKKSKDSSSFRKWNDAKSILDSEKNELEKAEQNRRNKLQKGGKPEKIIDAAKQKPNETPDDNNLFNIKLDDKSGEVKLSSNLLSEPAKLSFNIQNGAK